MVTAAPSRASGGAAAIATRRVILESPWASDPGRNRIYLAQALRDSIRRGEAPIASHALAAWGVLSEKTDRDLGISTGTAWLAHAEAMVVYEDYGISPGMLEAIKRARSIGLKIEYRFLYRSKNDRFLGP